MAQYLSVDSIIFHAVLSFFLCHRPKHIYRMEFAYSASTL